MKDFATSWHCLSRAHCRACRDYPAWRAAMAKTFVMPETCPYPEGRTFSIPTEAAGLCGQCLRRGCPNVHACCGGKVDLNIRIPCPDGLWNMIPATT